MHFEFWILSRKGRGREQTAQGMDEGEEKRIRFDPTSQTISSILESEIHKAPGLMARRQLVEAKIRCHLANNHLLGQHPQG